MFAGERADVRARKAAKVTRALANYPQNKSHERHFDAEECAKIGLTIRGLEEDPKLQDLVLTVHHCYMHLLSNTPVFKIIENHIGVGLSKNTPPFPQGTPGQKQLSEQAL